MKLKLVITLIVLSININAQNKLKGTYLLGTGYEAWKITFNENSEFEYYFTSCTGGNEGQGTYTLTKDSLHLLFKSSSKSLKQEIFTDSIYSCNKKDSININITITDYTEPITFATIKVGNNLCISDEDGRAKITLAKDTSLIQIDTKYIGYESIRFWIRPNACRNLKINLTDNFIEPIKEGTIYDYKIKIKSKKSHPTKKL